ncbi:MAG TPA: TfpX/TfpZ family type IV pilin accessory protein [Ramlibacter sp.]|nr:TfpX/TfpZ family type IV pilin accessory protein [Ramlibacter sp.]
MQQASVPADHHTASFDWRSRLRAAGIHLGLSALVAAASAVLVFAIWYPFPYSEISAGRELFLIVVAVDVVLGPLITFAVFDRRKPRKELRRDLAVVGLLQLAGLAYGLWAVNLARPVHLVYELDRFRVVHQVEIPEELLDRTPPGVTAIPLGGPTLLSLRPFASEQERVAFTTAALAGVHLSARPDLWQPYEAGRERIRASAKPVAQLKARFPDRVAEIDAALRKAAVEPAQAAYLPLIARKADAWTVLLDARNAQVIGFVPLDSF